jgi:hypothetical protein
VLLNDHVFTRLQLSTKKQFCSVGIYARSLHDRAMAEAVSCFPVTVKTWVPSQARPYGICDGQSGTGTGTGFSLSALVFPVRSIVPVLHTHSFVTNVYNFTS